MSKNKPTSTNRTSGKVQLPTGVIHTGNCHTVGELLDELSTFAADHELDMQSVMDSSVESEEDVFHKFTITRERLTDGSYVLNFEFVSLKL